MQTKPFFFGDSNEQLFGIQTVPDINYNESWGALVCFPLGQEYLRGYQAMQRLATELAKSGVCVMRFDYFGTGDSAGEAHFADPARCVADIDTALSEFRDTCQFEKLALIGLRMGANLAAHYQQAEFERLVLIDPVVDGAAYLAELESMHERLVLDLDRYLDRRLEHAGSSARELIGFGRVESAAEAFSKFDLRRLSLDSRHEVYLLASEDSKAAEELAGQWRDSGSNVTCERIDADGNWSSLASIEEPLKFWPIIRRCADIFSTS